ncbi:hypothetical protein CVIRNUC_007100 [Coccomyxa viridis]|uniref:Formate/nitrite transporter n=1 Tax=Coccomyxa viridis TaxID=1274662 RepID=A0AAV1ICA3_9CHLO|nr:hypothetical protein CVIRNUC_007100 [Coccomyxa viridis]
MAQDERPKVQDDDTIDTVKAQAVPQPHHRTPTIAFLPPPSLFDSVATTGHEKAETAWWKTFLLGVLAGVYIAFGGALSYAIGGQVPQTEAQNPGLQKLLFGAFGLSFGLALIVVCGGDLYTANTSFLSAAVFEGKANVFQLVKNWVCSFLGNLAGALFIVFLLFETKIFVHEAEDGMNFAKDTAILKTSSDFGATVVKGILANWLVNLAYWQATGAQDVISKIVGAYFPVLAFEALAFEHVVADMFFVPFGIKLGAPVSVGRYIVHNMIPVAIGNTIAGVFFVALPYALLYGNMTSNISSHFSGLLHGDSKVLPKSQKAVDAGHHEQAQEYTL